MSVSDALNLMLTFGIFLIALLTYIHSDTVVRGCPSDNRVSLSNYL